MKPEAWHPSLLTMLFWCHGCLWTPMSFQPLSVDVSFSWHPYLLASLSLETFFSWHFLLSTPHSLDTFFIDTCVWFLFLHPFLFETSFCQNCLPLGPSFVLRWMFILMSFSWHFSLLASLFSWISRYYFVQPSLHKVLPSTTSCYEAYIQVLLRTTKLAHNTPSTTSYYKVCAKRFRVLLRRRLAQITSRYYFVLQNLQKNLSRY